MELTLGVSERIPHPDGGFNMVFAVPDPQRQIEEIGRVMSNEGLSLRKAPKWREA
jgi:hypothetical protein